MSPTDRHRLGPTRVRDLVVVGVVAGAIAYALTRFNYNSIPTLPRLSGVTAALLGAAEAIAGYGLRARIREHLGPRRTGPGGPGGSGRDGRDSRDGRPPRPPVPPLTAARALAVAKASALAGAALAGLWLGFGMYVAMEPAAVLAARSDTVTAAIGLVCAAVLIAGALFLESCCRTPEGGGSADPPWPG